MKKDEKILVMKDVTKSYGNQKIVEGVNLHLNRGDIYGLIGENGAGKTTIIRLLTALIDKDSGEIEKKENLKIGAVIENPAFYPYLSGYENLNYYAKIYGLRNPDHRIMEVLDLVNLRHGMNKPYKDYSLGMKQRLGIALSILNQPDLLILDEPINGLDPSGIKEVRELIVKLAKDFGTTVLISSHILTELSLIANKYGFVHQGHLMREYSKDELFEQLDRHLLLDTSDNKKSQKILDTLAYRYQLTSEGFVLEEADSIVQELSEKLYEAKVRIWRLEHYSETLEEFFIRLKGDYDYVSTIKG